MLTQLHPRGGAAPAGLRTRAHDAGHKDDRRQAGPLAARDTLSLIVQVPIDSQAQTLTIGVNPYDFMAGQGITKPF